MSLFARSGSAQKPVNISRRSFLTAAGMTAIALPVLAACGNAGGTASFSAPDVKAPSEFAGRTNVVIWSPWSGNNHEVFTGVVDGFNRSQSDIYAEVQQFNGYDGVTEKIAAGLQARQIPDIGVFSDVSWNKFFLNDTLEPLGGNSTTTSARARSTSACSPRALSAASRTGSRSADRHHCSTTTRRSSRPQVCRIAPPPPGMNSVRGENKSPARTTMAIL